MNNEQDVAMGGVACAAVCMPLVIAGDSLALGASLAVKETCLAPRGAFLLGRGAHAAVKRWWLAEL